MSRRVSLPGADELFRTTGGSGLQSPAPRKSNGPANGVPASGVPAGNGETARVPAPGGEPGAGAGEETTPRRAEPDSGPEGPAVEHAGRGAEADAPKGRRRQDAEAAASQPAGSSRRRGRGANRRPSGRERHDEKITVYVSAEELMDLEHARLVLRGEHGLAVDRGRIVREAVAVVLADLESRGDASILVRRLRGR
ncbi:hypothetical protein OEIGOIKO_06536 [Streptomyces chrestomyceticus JCM 4735]|uniref:Uncharacterized protein n=1 Tax=Streptomyces chrestomyceticus JCM 4735 TaxID=1306181 RepID=A0A7U9L1M2_9ACTN|nr:hypothetical protein [Streptomyces chrestomyceticus]GCD38717.1 hypothetical protein OEIGOIKO_06536 [Streptomyces chrestomyceticus JCM 4735]